SLRDGKSVRTSEKAIDKSTACALAKAFQTLHEAFIMIGTLTSCSGVIAGLDPAIHHFCERRWMRGSKPAHDDSQKSGYSAATRCARAYSASASSATGAIGVKSRCAIHSARVNLVMWLEQAQNVT